MSGKEKFINARNRFSPDGETEILGHFQKSGKAYFLRVFFGKFFWQCLAFTAIAAGLYFLAVYFGNEDGMLYYIPLFFMCLGPFIYTVNLLIKSYCWKYVKHVVVTNEGIWLGLSGCSFWWNKSFDGKKRFIGANWTIYDWAELNGLFEEQCTISKIYKLKDMILSRWDGEQSVRFLKAADFDAIQEYAKGKLNSRKLKPRKTKRKYKWWEKLFIRNE